MSASGKQRGCTKMRLRQPASSAPAYDGGIAALRTELMQAAAARGLQVVDGTAMIRHQLPLQTALWCGET